MRLQDISPSTERVLLKLESSHILESLYHSSLPARIKRSNPQIKIDVFDRGKSGALARAIFEGNPHVDRRVMFGRPGVPQITGLPRINSAPETKDRCSIYLSDTETHVMRKFIALKTLPENRGKPLCVIDPWGLSEPSVPHNSRTVEMWAEVIRKNKDRFRFWQVGWLGQGAVQGCEYYYFIERGQYFKLRQHFTLINLSQALVGNQRGYADVARGFDIPVHTITGERSDDLEQFFRSV